MQLLGFSQWLAEERGFHSDLAAIAAALCVHAKLHHIAGGQQQNGPFSVIEAFGAFLLEVGRGVASLRHHPDSGQRSTIAAAQRLRVIGAGAFRGDRIAAALVSSRRNLATSARDRAAKRSHGLRRAAGQLRGRRAHLQGAFRPHVEGQ